MADPHKHEHERVADHHDQVADAGNHPPDVSAEFRRELQHDYDTGNGKKLMEELKEHHMKIEDLKEIDNKFGVITIDDGHGHDFTVREGGHRDKDGTFVLDNGCKIDKDGKIKFNDGVTISADGLVTENGKIDESVSDSNAVAAAKAGTTSGDAAVISTTTAVNTAVDGAANGTVSPENLTSTASQIQETINGYAAKGQTPPEGLLTALTTLQTARTTLTGKDNGDGNGTGNENDRATPSEIAQAA